MSHRPAASWSTFVAAAAQIAAGAVTTPKIADANVTLAKLASGLGFPRVARSQLGADAPNIDFTGLSGANSYLLLASLRSTVAALVDTLAVRINNYSGANHASQQMQAANAAQADAGAGSQTSARMAGIVGDTGAAGVAGIAVAVILCDPAGQLNFPWVCMYGANQDFTNAANQLNGVRSGIVNNGSGAITQITLFPVTGPNFKSNSWAALYEFV